MDMVKIARVSVIRHRVAESAAGTGQEAARGPTRADHSATSHRGSSAMPSLSLSLSRPVAFRSLAVLGWGYALAAWYVMGHAAGVDPGFLLGLSAGITFSLCSTICRVLPESQTVFALGFREGQRAQEDSEAPPPLALVR